MTWLRELTSDDAGRPSSMRVMMLLGMVTGSVVMLADIFGLSKSTTDYSTTLALLFGAIFGTKAWQKHAEKSNP